MLLRSEKKQTTSDVKMKIPITSVLTIPHTRKFAIFVVSSLLTWKRRRWNRVNWCITLGHEFDKVRWTLRIIVLLWTRVWRHLSAYYKHKKKHTHRLKEFWAPFKEVCNTIKRDEKHIHTMILYTTSSYDNFLKATHLQSTSWSA